MKKILKSFTYILKVLIIMCCVFSLNTTASSLINDVKNSNLDKTVDMTVMSEYVSNISNGNIKDYSSVLFSLDGSLTGYVYNCPLCSGRLACKSSLDLSGGLIYYQDEQYGDVRIVASSKNLPCGTIVKFTSSRVGEGETYAIVLDRGVPGNDIDLLVENLDVAYDNIGRSNIHYDIVRNGWN